MDPAEILPGNMPAQPPAPEPTRGAKNIACDFCECSLTPSGDFLKLSDKAKQLRDQGETLEKANAKILELTRELQEARNAIARLETAAAPKKTSLW